MIDHPLVLRGWGVELRPLEMSDFAGLARIVGDGEIWRYFRTGSLEDPEKLQGWIGEALRLREAGVDYPFVTIDLGTEQIVGSTRYRLIDGTNRSVEIGGTWLGREFWGTGVNLAAKRLMLEHAFERMGVIRVQFRTDARNTRSQRAVEGLGAQREGVFRKDFIYADGYQRSSVFYSITDDEWPAVKLRLAERGQRS